MDMLHSFSPCGVLYYRRKGGTGLTRHVIDGASKEQMAQFLAPRGVFRLPPERRSKREQLHRFSPLEASFYYRQKGSAGQTRHVIKRSRAGTVCTVSRPSRRILTTALKVARARPVSYY